MGRFSKCVQAFAAPILRRPRTSSTPPVVQDVNREQHAGIAAHPAYDAPRLNDFVEELGRSWPYRVASPCLAGYAPCVPFVRFRCLSRRRSLDFGSRQAGDVHGQGDGKAPVIKSFWPSIPWASDKRSKRQAGVSLVRIDEAAIRKYCKNKPHVALTIATHEKGVDAVRSYGDEGVPVAPETRAYEIGSISKVFLSTLLAKCVEEGEAEPRRHDRSVHRPPLGLRLSIAFFGSPRTRRAIPTPHCSTLPGKRFHGRSHRSKSKATLSTISGRNGSSVRLPMLLANVARRKAGSSIRTSAIRFWVMLFGRAMGSTYHQPHRFVYRKRTETFVDDLWPGQIAHGPWLQKRQGLRKLEMVGKTRPMLPLGVSARMRPICFPSPK